MKFHSNAPAFLVVLSHLAAAVQPPARIVDAHHHYLDLGGNSFSSWLGGLFGNFAYLPEHYTADVVEPLAQSNITLTGSVHIEVLTDTPFGGVEEAAWVQSLAEQGDAPELRAIVGSCDLGDADNVEECLSEMVDASPLVRGIRWILDYVGPFDGSSATHVNAARKDIDYLRGGADGGVVPEFEEGYALLGEYGLSFDAQFAPEQAPAMATLASRYPNIPVIINHLGKPRLVLGPDSNATEPDQVVLAEWREGMALLAALPNTYVKLSMLGYIVPDWITEERREQVIRDLVLETVEMFGPKRCMFALNWYLGASISDNDGLGSIGPNPVELTDYMSNWLANYSDEDRECIFSKTAETVYKFGEVSDGMAGVEETQDAVGSDPSSSVVASVSRSGILAMLVGSTIVVLLC